VPPLGRGQSVRRGGVHAVEEAVDDPDPTHRVEFDRVCLGNIEDGGVPDGETAGASEHEGRARRGEPAAAHVPRAAEYG
jgi:hypothetical protein